MRVYPTCNCDAGSEVTEVTNCMVERASIVSYYYNYSWKYWWKLDLADFSKIKVDKFTAFTQYKLMFK